MSLLEKLSPELILRIASFLEQIDLLNVSLTCRYLKETTESELYRMFSNPFLHSCTIAKFVLRLVKRPKLAEYVRAIDLKGWQTLNELDPIHYVSNYELSGIQTTREEKIETFDRFQKPEPTEDEYALLTAAGMTAGIIKEALPYDPESDIIQKVRSMLPEDAPRGSPWFNNIFGDDAVQNMPFDQKFCELLRAGIEDAYVALLLALLQNLKTLFLGGVERDPISIGLSRPLHGFRALQTLKLCCMETQEAWGIDYLESILAGSALKELYVHNASSWCQQDPYDVNRPVTLRLLPGSLHLTTLEMVDCTLWQSEMQTLLNATKSLRSLLYWTGDEEWNFTSHELVEMLEPFKDTLEKLFLEIAPFWTDFEDEGRLTTLSHFSALKVLDTTSAMWENLTELEIDGHPIDAEQYLCYRLPPNLETLILHSPPRREGDRGDWDELNNPDKCQIQHLILEHTSVLPQLHHVYIGSACDRYAYHLDRMFLEQYQAQCPNLKFIVGSGRTHSAPTKSFVDDLPPALSLPEKIWDGEKYSYFVRDKFAVSRSTLSAESVE
ncbi:hypothetical protein OPT61_g2140 [Boeremia exigua]|uniref:Uncharacterized protein n=1 Tax=Boeremia exigua TaxID=749465 RepID=A0ACC2IMU3_9PLEO|nr:hypothetical protein OPT61_g2140 [Boeremia exigua]